MNYQIQAHSSIPAYVQLYRLLAGDIVSGSYHYGSRLPSKRTIAAETGVSVITVEHALELLSDEGYVQSRARSGYYVIYRRADFHSRENLRQPDHVIENRPSRVVPETDPGEVFPYSVFARTIRKVLQDYGESIMMRSPGQGSMQLRIEICSYLARSHGIQVKPGQVVIGAGAEYLYSLLPQLLGRERVFALEEPSYNKIRKVYESSGVRCEMLPIGQDGIAWEQLKRSKAGALHVTPFHSYPSGVTISISKKHEYLQWAASRNGIIIEDNYDSELTVSKKEEDTLFSLAEGVDVIYINTFSKTISSSMRVGYLLLPEHLAETFDKKLGFYSCTVPLLEQYTIAQLLRSGDFERHINRVRRARRRNQSGQ